MLEEDIKKLSGGGDWHCAYILLYGPRRIKCETVNSRAAETQATSPTDAAAAPEPMENWAKMAAGTLLVHGQPMLELSTTFYSIHTQYPIELRFEIE